MAVTAPFARSLLAISLVVTFCYFIFQPFDSISPSRIVDWSNLDALLSTGVHGGAHETAVSASTDTCQPDQEIVKEYGAHNIRRSRAHTGSGWRVQQKLLAASRGEPLKVALIGGSVSTGHGSIPGKGNHQYGAIAFSDRWHQYVVAYLNSTFPQVTFEDGARPAVDSSFFAWCYTASISTDADLIFLEMGVNDERTKEAEEASETLLRSLLLLENSPAVIYVESFSLRSKSGRGGMTSGEDVHKSLASFYDVPQISLRSPLLPALLDQPRRNRPYFEGDVRHISKPLHSFLGAMVTVYLQEEACRMQDEQLLTEDEEYNAEESDNGLWPGRGLLGQVPKLKLSDDWSSTKSYPMQPPQCRIAGETLASSNSSSGWRLYSWKDAKHYLEALLPAKTIEFEVEVREGAVGQIALGYLRSAQYGLGSVLCQVGAQKVVIDGLWTKGTSLAQTQVVAQGLEPGRHTLACTTMEAKKKGGGTAFRIMSVMSV